MKAYSKDLRQKIVDAIERGMPTATEARELALGGYPRWFMDTRTVWEVARWLEAIHDPGYLPTSTHRWLQDALRRSDRGCPAGVVLAC
jgi:hypothetical protein